MKTEQVVKAELINGLITSFAPFTHASSEWHPRPLNCRIFSTIIIELSIIRPIPKISPAREITFTEMSKRYNPNNVMTKDIGTTIQISKAIFQLLKNVNVAATCLEIYRNVRYHSK